MRRFELESLQQPQHDPADNPVRKPAPSQTEASHQPALPGKRPGEELHADEPEHLEDVLQRPAERQPARCHPAAVGPRVPEQLLRRLGLGRLQPDDDPQGVHRPAEGQRAGQRLEAEAGAAVGFQPEQGPAADRRAAAEPERRSDPSLPAGAEQEQRREQHDTGHAAAAAGNVQDAAAAAFKRRRSVEPRERKWREQKPRKPAERFELTWNA